MLWTAIGDLAEDPEPDLIWKHHNRHAKGPYDGDFYFHVMDGDRLYVGLYWIDPGVVVNGKRTLATLEDIRCVQSPSEPPGGWWS